MTYAEKIASYFFFKEYVELRNKIYQGGEFMNFVFYDLIPMLTQEELTYLFENRTTFEEFKKIITSNKACKRFYKTENDLKSFYAQFKMMKDKNNTSSEPSVAFSVKIESDKTLNMKKIERKMSKVDVDSIIKDLMALDYSDDEIRLALQEEFTKAINDEDVNVVVYNGEVSEKQLIPDSEDESDGLKSAGLASENRDLISVELPDDFDIDDIQKVIDFIEENPKCDPVEIEDYAESMRKTSRRNLLNRLSNLFKL